MELEIRNDRFWEYIPIFFVKHIELPVLGVEILGYFPYHTARIRPCAHTQFLLPRTFFHEFEQLLLLNNIDDNKAVYICKSILKENHSYFAIMLKDDYAVVGAWDQVVTYDNKPLKVVKLMKDEEKNQ
jgi:hypothetical protein